MDEQQIRQTIKACNKNEKKVLDYLCGLICSRTVGNIMAETGLTIDETQTALSSLVGKELVVCAHAYRYYTRTSIDRIIQEVLERKN